ncbi:hypothetical protein [Sporosarcina sp. Te-1]|uniref:hypothetical protein n=1 Tax=Sporosarcina sp. Te-1 TaxID=2818390 RepID=UPI001A9DA43C|nr:hypothetical protein [Sporosarcina sp. Te-1]QTD42917.1 hypothetical protein J3U78_09325 [Sporosarcina sp. Te-1]
MKRVWWVFIVSLLVTGSAISTSKVSTSSNNEAETIIHQYINYITSKKWNEYVDLFHYDSEVHEDLLLYLNDQKNQFNREGIHGIQDMKLVSMEVTSDLEFSSKGDEVYDVLLDMKVHKPSEFYENGVSRHMFVFNRTSEGLQLETVYYKGVVQEN